MSTVETYLLVLIALINLGTSTLALFTHLNMRKLEKNTNSKMDELLEVTGDAERAKGVLQGKQEKAIKKGTVK